MLKGTKKERPRGRSFFVCLRNVFDRNDGAELQGASEVWHALLHERNNTFGDSVECVIFANTNVLAGMNFGTALANQDVSWADLGAVRALYSEAFCLGIAAVTCRTLG